MNLGPDPVARDPPVVEVADDLPREDRAQADPEDDERGDVDGREEPRSEAWGRCGTHGADGGPSRKRSAAVVWGSAQTSRRPNQR